MKTANLDKWKQPDPMSTDEQDKIREVIEKAEAMEKAEMERVGYVSRKHLFSIYSSRTLYVNFDITYYVSSDALATHTAS